MIDPSLPIIVVGVVIILYFWLKPKKVSKPKDELTNPIHVEGLPPSYPNDGGGNII